MAILDRKVKTDQVANSSQPEQPFAEIEAKKLANARSHSGIRRFAEFSRRYLDRLRAEGRIG